MEGAEVAMKDVDDFCSTRPPDDVIPSDGELGAIFDGDVPESTRICVQAARQRLADVVNMCDKRRQSLKKINKKHSLSSSSSLSSPSSGGRGGRGGGEDASSTEPHTAANGGGVGGGGPPVGTVAPIPRAEVSSCLLLSLSDSSFYVLLCTSSSLARSRLSVAVGRLSCTVNFHSNGDELSISGIMVEDIHKQPYS